VVFAARHARELVTDACARWNVPALVGPGCIVVTELANNAVVHARTPMEIILSVRGRQLNVAVRDRSSAPPEIRGPAVPASPGGRGLMMVDAVAQRWGWTPADDGKVVWAALVA
jgi:anti-sigma regulatory factor (Ser/Thr protein kinase)